MLSHPTFQEPAISEMLCEGYLFQVLDLSPLNHLQSVPVSSPGSFSVSPLNDLRWDLLMNREQTESTL